MLYNPSLLIFLSTLSLRRATGKIMSVSSGLKNFYPRSPCGERPAIDVFLAVWAVISIHALLAESDQVCTSMLYYTCKFLSTLSLRRATVLAWCSFGGASDFYPRSPCGERLRQRLIKLGKLRFLSTLSLRRATLT